MNTAYLLTGGNIGNRKQNLGDAADALAGEAGNITALSGIYETAAWGKTNQPSFLNQCVGIETTLAPMDLLHIIMGIEKKMGRHREQKYGPRIIDIDILLYNHDIVDEPFLQIPHPQLVNRRFALEPLAEIASAFIHPVLNKTISELLIECKDALPVKKLENW
ncbi:MAG: 2-amino-4-hydroxy-6-hydroxymethyldihydropteridine diphosphokinase [Chitinophagaceae bacterium]|nr:2-amino-4-hydroxy-6-hydroxymethyldihydropteridine diphosphokinase [Chitinophagaceae bacterium]